MKNLTRQEALDKINAACVKANPAILELKFGCKLSDGQEEKIIVDANGQYWCCNDGTKFNRAALMSYEKGDRVFLNWKVFFILGRDIQLADVLLALHKEFTSDLSLYEAMDKLIHPIWGNGKIRFEQKWNLLKPLHEQDDPTLFFIADLL